jgi:hypothetical protein
MTIPIKKIAKRWMKAPGFNLYFASAWGVT